NDKVAHAVTFSVLAFLYSHTLGKKYGFQAIVLLAGFGILIELIQYFLPWRSFSWLDWVADLVGIFVYEIIHRVKRVLLKKQ
ncbi:MAG: VanZ family protein, partial [Gammaproteobacteria bacterium]|nr:VanZ family protein [Gammaproteobacteria bacterium]